MALSTRSPPPIPPYPLQMGSSDHLIDPLHLDIDLHRTDNHKSNSRFGSTALHAVGVIRSGLLRCYLPVPGGGTPCVLCGYPWAQLFDVEEWTRRGVQYIRLSVLLPWKHNQRVCRICEPVSLLLLGWANYGERKIHIKFKNVNNS